MTSTKRYFFLLFAFFFLSIASTSFGARENRIVALAPSHTELLYAMGLGDQIVGVSEYSDYPEDTLTKPTIGDIELNIEKIIALRPTLIVDANSMRKGYAAIFKQLNLNYVDFKMQELTDLLQVATSLGELLSEQEKAASFTKAWAEKLESIATPTNAQPLTFYAEIWGEPMQAAGPTSFVSKIIEKAGIKNVIKSNVEYPVINKETVVSLNPDIIFLIYPTKKDSITRVKKRAAWAHIKAIKAGRLYALEQDLFVRPSPRNLDGVEIINNLLQNQRDNQ
jgi:iron complex transport system substrate-binding protein